MSTDKTVLTNLTGTDTDGTQLNPTQLGTPQTPSINQLLQEAQEGTNDDVTPPLLNVQNMYSLHQNSLSAL
jgi:hypothetical protein